MSRHGDSATRKTMKNDAPAVPVGRHGPVSAAPAMSVADTAQEHTESLLEVYWRRFKKHRLGKIGGSVLVVLYALAQRYLVSGLTLGAVKQ